MAPSEGGDPPPGSSTSDLQAFQALISSYAKTHKVNPHVLSKNRQKFPRLLCMLLRRPLALRLADRGLIGQFTGLWPSPKSMHLWLESNWRKLIQGQMSATFCGKGFFAFLFEKKEDRDLIFRSDPYFMGARGMYLNKWTPDFSPENDIPSAVPVWVRLPFLPLHCWNDETIRSIGNSLGKYIDRAEP
jgi:hypothetical protein